MVSNYFTRYVFENVRELQFIYSSMVIYQFESLLLSLLVTNSFCIKFVDVGELLSLLVLTIGSAGMRPSFIRFFCFILLFWNHIFTCVSFSCNADAISILLALVRYLLKWNSFSSSVSCLFVKLVLPVFKQFKLRMLEALEPKQTFLEAGLWDSMSALVGGEEVYSVTGESGIFGPKKEIKIIWIYIVDFNTQRLRQLSRYHQEMIKAVGRGNHLRMVPTWLAKPL